MATRQLKPVFKTYAQHQAFLIPPSFDDLIAPAHPVRTVNTVLESLDIDLLLKKYKGGGTSAYHPRMLLKVLVYAYITNTYSSRKIEEACTQNIHFMWLAGMQRPDHNTINRFRSERMKEALRQVFIQVVQVLAAEGLLTLKELCTDGTKIESAANRYTFVWGAAIKTNKEKIAAQLKELWSYAQTVAKQESQDTTPPPDFSGPGIDSAKVKEAVAQIEQALHAAEARQKGAVSEKVIQRLSYAKKNWPEALDKYAAQELILGSRKSYSKTDPDATFMRMKEDHMKNGQLKPGYNIQLSTSNQYAVSYTIHPNPTDTATLPAHLEQIKRDCRQAPEVLIADAGYGSEQNYGLLEKEGITAFVKYGYFDKDQKAAAQSAPGRRGKKAEDRHPFSAGKLHYNKEKDCFTCPMGQAMERTGTRKRVSENGYVQELACYQAKNCEGCPLRGVCHQGKGARIIEVNHNLNRHKAKAHALLTSEEGVRRRKKRCWDTEPVFGDIKHNHGFRRFLLRGNEKVEIETGLLLLAHNLRKKCKLKNGKTGTQIRKAA